LGINRDCYRGYNINRCPEYEKFRKRIEVKKMYSDPRVQQLLDGPSPEETPETSDYTKLSLSPEYRAVLIKRASQILKTLGILDCTNDFLAFVAVGSEYYHQNLEEPVEDMLTKDG
jgi:hypothetical protein